MNKTIWDVLLLEYNLQHDYTKSHLPVIEYFPIATHPDMFYSLFKSIE